MYDSLMQNSDRRNLRKSQLIVMYDSLKMDSNHRKLRKNQLIVMHDNLRRRLSRKNPRIMVSVPRQRKIRK